MQPYSLLTALQIVITCIESKPRTAAMVPGCVSQASCMALARARTSLKSVFKPSRYPPAAKTAVYSPTECLANIPGLRLGKLERTAASKATIASWALTVLASSSLGPSNIMSVMGKPRSSLIC